MTARGRAAAEDEPGPEPSPEICGARAFLASSALQRPPAAAAVRELAVPRQGRKADDGLGSGFQAGAKHVSKPTPLRRLLKDAAMKDAWWLAPRSFSRGAEAISGCQMAERDVEEAPEAASDEDLEECKLGLFTRKCNRLTKAIEGLTEVLPATPRSETTEKRRLQRYFARRERALREVSHSLSGLLNFCPRACDIEASAGDVAALVLPATLVGAVEVVANALSASPKAAAAAESSEPMTPSQQPTKSAPELERPMQRSTKDETFECDAERPRPGPAPTKSAPELAPPVQRSTSSADCTEKRVALRTTPPLKLIWPGTVSIIGRQTSGRGTLDEVHQLASSPSRRACVGAVALSPTRKTATMSVAAFPSAAPQGVVVSPPKVCSVMASPGSKALASPSAKMFVVHSPQRQSSARSPGPQRAVSAGCSSSTALAAAVATAGAMAGSLPHSPERSWQPSWSPSSPRQAQPSTTMPPPLPVMSGSRTPSIAGPAVGAPALAHVVGPPSVVQRQHTSASAPSSPRQQHALLLAASVPVPPPNHALPLAAVVSSSSALGTARGSCHTPRVPLACAVPIPRLRSGQSAEAEVCLEPATSSSRSLLLQGQSSGSLNIAFA